MGSSPLRTEFLVNDSSIDCSCITVPAHDASDGWLLSSPITTIFSKMHLSRPRKVSSSPESDGYLSPTTLDRLTKACQATSKELQNRLSISSESSDPGMMYDPFTSSGSDTSFDDSLTRNPSEADLAALQTENETWDLYWTPVKNSTLPLRSDAYRSPLHQGNNLSPCNRNFASSNLSTFGSQESSQNLRRTNTRRVPRRPNRSSPPSLPVSGSAYSPFPNCAPSVLGPSVPSTIIISPQLDYQRTNPQHVQHKSWPTRTTSTIPTSTSRPLLRRRADTTPSTPSRFTPVHPSNLSTCTTLDYQSSRTSSRCETPSPLYMRSPPCRPMLLEMGIGNETSVWEDDDEDEGIGGLVGSLRSKLHIRSASTQAEMDADFGVKARQSGKRTKRSLSEVVKGVFRARKKGGTL